MSIPFIRTELQKKLDAIELENKTIRDEFNVQRAKLKDIFLQKEGMRSSCSVHLCCCCWFNLLKFFQLEINCQYISGECKKQSDELLQLRKELNEIKSQVVVAEYQRQSDIQHQDRKAQEEIASLQHIVHGSFGHFV